MSTQFGVGASEQSSLKVPLESIVQVHPHTFDMTTVGGCVVDGDADGVMETEAVDDTDTDTEGDADTDTEVEDVADINADCDGDTDMEVEDVGDTDGVIVAEGDIDGVIVAEGDGLRGDKFMQVDLDTIKPGHLHWFSTRNKVRQCRSMQQTGP